MRQKPIRASLKSWCPQVHTRLRRRGIKWVELAICLSSHNISITKLVYMYWCNCSTIERTVYNIAKLYNNIELTNAQVNSIIV